MLDIVAPGIAARRSMKIDASTAQKSKNQIDKAILKINAHLQHHTFLAGNDFSRADLAVAALLAPISMPEKYPVSLNISSAS